MASTKKKSNTYCSVRGCSTYYTTTNKVSFHSLPKDNNKKIQCQIKWVNENGVEEMIDRRQAWILRLQMDQNDLKKSHIKICSKHFTKNDFILPDFKLSRARLTQVAVPSLNLPPIKTHYPIERKSQIKKKEYVDTNLTEVVREMDSSVTLPLSLNSEEQNSMDITENENSGLEPIADQILTTPTDAAVQNYRIIKKSKNPFVRCKSRKRKKLRVVKKQGPKLFCPQTMVRFDGSPNEYFTMWFCKMCKTCLLSESAVSEHVEKCKAVTHEPVPVKNDEDVRYICEICNKVFSRYVTLKKHKEEHEKSNSESDNEIDYTMNSPKKKKRRVSLTTPKLEFITDEADVSNTTTNIEYS